MLDLIALDVGLRLGDLDAYYSLTREQRVELRAYWRVRTEMRPDDLARFSFLTTIPRDFIPIPRTLRHIPAEEYGRPRAPASVRPKGWKEASGTPITVYDGGRARPPTAAEAQAVEAVAAGKMREHWAKTTGSSSAAIDWWLNPEA